MRICDNDGGRSDEHYMQGRFTRKRRESEEKAGEDGKSREKDEDVNRRPMEILFNWDVVFVSSSCRI